VPYPYFDNVLYISLLDYDFLSKNDFLGDNSFDIECLLDKEEHHVNLDVIYLYEKHGELEISFKISNGFKKSFVDHYNENKEIYDEEKKNRLEGIKTKKLLNFLILGSSSVGKSTLRFLLFIKVF
jgi:hypothetical protein